MSNKIKLSTAIDGAQFVIGDLVTIDDPGHSGELDQQIITECPPGLCRIEAIRKQNEKWPDCMIENYNLDYKWSIMIVEDLTSAIDIKSKKYYEIGYDAVVEKQSIHTTCSQINVLNLEKFPSITDLAVKTGPALHRIFNNGTSVHISSTGSSNPNYKCVRVYNKINIKLNKK